MNDWNRSSLAEDGLYSFQKNTFVETLDKIERIFNIRIAAHKEHQSFGYYIDNPEQLYSSDTFIWLLHSLQAGVMMCKYKSLQSRFVIEEFPSSITMMKPITDAMTRNLRVFIRYKKYDDKPYCEHTIEPYCIKTYKHRFYVLGRMSSGRFCMFAFDRIIDIKITYEEFFIDEDFDAKEFFKPFYGVFTSHRGLQITDITIRAHGNAQHYLRDVPLHSSQREIGQGENYADFQITIYPTTDFLGDIIQQAGRLEIIAPDNVRQQVKEILADSLKIYED